MPSYLSIAAIRAALAIVALSRTIKIHSARPAGDAFRADVSGAARWPRASSSCAAATAGTS